MPGAFQFSTKKMVGSYSHFSVQLLVLHSHLTRVGDAGFCSITDDQVIVQAALKTAAVNGKMHRLFGGATTSHRHDHESCGKQHHRALL